MATFKVCDNDPVLVPQPSPGPDSGGDGHFLARLPEYEQKGCYRVLQGSCTGDAAQRLHPCSNGFVSSAVEAYSRHHNLVLRPDDVWLAIAVQFGFFVNGNAEALRSIFVDHEGKKELTVSQAAALQTADYGLLAREMSVQLKNNIKDGKVCDWILPGFSTTTKNDVVVGSIVLMASFKSYFTYSFELTCGIPSVTLLGTTFDWEELDRRVDELDKYGIECQKWRVMLKKITGQFVESSKGNVDTDFWNRICHHLGGGSGPSFISGWISAFCVFDSEGKWRGDHKTYRDYWSDQSQELEYPCIKDNKVPAGYLTVDVKINDNGTKYEAFMFAGHLGYAAVDDDARGIAAKAAWAITLKDKAKAKTRPSFY